MSSNWWQRFFNLEDDGDASDEKNYFYNPSEPRMKRKIVGRFEDSHRHLRVKMQHQYGSPEDASIRELYERRGTSDVKGKKAARSDHAKKTAAKGQDTVRGVSPEKRKAPFRPTQVPSPVFGYRKPPEHFYRKKRKEEDLHLEPAKEEQERKQIAGEKSRQLQKTLPPLPSDEPKIDTSRIDEPSYKRRNLERQKNRAGEGDGKQAPFLSEAYPVHATCDPQPADVEKETAGGRTETQRRTKADDADDHLPPQPVRQAPVQESGPAVTADTKDPAAAEKPEEADNRPIPVKSSLNQSPYRDHRAPSKVPFNVLMFHADRRKPASESESRNGFRQLPAGQREQGGLKLPLDLLADPPEVTKTDSEWIAERQRVLDETLKNFHVKADIVDHIQGPSVTRFDIHLHPGVKINKVLNLTEDIKLSLAAKQIRIAAVPGKSAVGIEIPNETQKPVYLKQILSSEAFQKAGKPLLAALGQDVSGQNVVTDISKMPHGLIAGATGSGKSVCIHSMILSLIYNTPPDDLRLLLIDPKVVELAPYQKLPHLAAPVINEPKEASLALKWAVEEMEHRYQLFAEKGVRDIGRYNAQAEKETKMPFIVIVIDELADLMMVSPQDVEESICRIAQKARAAGIHLLLATQRPSVDVITGLIKSNIPTRIAFSVSSQADSRTIIDSGGAERLLGRGDMLFMENGARDVRRLQGCFVSDEDIQRVTDRFEAAEAPDYLFDKDAFKQSAAGVDESEDDLFDDAAHFVIEQGQASVSSLQRNFRIGYNRAARLVDELESLGVISEANGSKPRQILMTRETFEEYSRGREIY